MSIVIVGAGPNLGLAVARRFGRERFAVGLISRTQSRLDDLARQLGDEGITAAGAAADIRDSDGLAAVNPYPLRAGVGISFAGEVAYARMLHDELRDAGVHVAHTAIGGRIAPGADHEPADVADVLWSHHTERATFQTRLGIPA